MNRRGFFLRSLGLLGGLLLPRWARGATGTDSVGVALADSTGAPLIHRLEALVSTG